MRHAAGGTAECAASSLPVSPVQSPYPGQLFCAVLPQCGIFLHEQVRLMQFELVRASCPFRRMCHRQTLCIDGTVNVLSARLRQRPGQRSLLRRCQESGHVIAVGAPATGEGNRPVIGGPFGLREFSLETTPTFGDDGGEVLVSRVRRRLQNGHVEGNQIAAQAVEAIDDRCGVVPRRRRHHLGDESAEFRQ